MTNCSKVIVFQEKFIYGNQFPQKKIYSLKTKTAGHPRKFPIGFWLEETVLHFTNEEKAIAEEI